VERRRATPLDARGDGGVTDQKSPGPAGAWRSPDDELQQFVAGHTRATEMGHSGKHAAAAAGGCGGG
jgi:hypothetical protein